MLVLFSLIAIPFAVFVRKFLSVRLISTAAVAADCRANASLFEQLARAR